MVVGMGPLSNDSVKEFPTDAIRVDSLMEKNDSKLPKRMETADRGYKIENERVKAFRFSCFIPSPFNLFRVLISLSLPHCLLTPTACSFLPP